MLNDFSVCTIEHNVECFIESEKTQEIKLSMQQESSMIKMRRLLDAKKKLINVSCILLHGLS